MPENLRQLLAKKRDRLDWDNFNFLENLFIFCIQKDYKVPAESGVRFRISREPKDDVICLLFRIDRQPDALIQEGVRPDYLVLYMDRDHCIFTIIEMKGRDSKNTEHGVEQIVSLRDRLRSEFREHFPLGNRAVFQGILLCPTGAAIPYRDISKQDFVILPILSSQQAELYPYVSKELEQTEKYANKPLLHSEKYGYLEKHIITGGLHQRLVPKSENGFSISYVLSPNAYAHLASSAGRNALSIKQNPRSKKIGAIRRHLALFPSLRDFQVNEITDDS